MHLSIIVFPDCLLSLCRETLTFESNSDREVRKVGINAQRHVWYVHITIYFVDTYFVNMTKNILTFSFKNLNRKIWLFQ